MHARGCQSRLKLGELLRHFATHGAYQVPSISHTEDAVDKADCTLDPAHQNDKSLGNLQSLLISQQAIKYTRLKETCLL